MTEDRSLLSKIADTLLGASEHRKPGDIFVIKEDLAGIRDHQSGHHIKACRLSSSVRTEKADDLALLDLHGDAFHDCPMTIFLDQVFATKFHTLRFI